jgi:hypothetical protein
LERSVDSDDPITQESHRTIAKWLKTFITQGAEDLRAMVETDLPANEGDEQYMEFDSDEGKSEGPNGSDPNPLSGITKG